MSAVDEMLRLVANLGKGGEVRENYIIPGLMSTELARTPAGGLVRLFEMTRDQEYDIVPHDHRFDFRCFVLSGHVLNREYALYEVSSSLGASHAALAYCARTHTLSDTPRWMRGTFTERDYHAGDWYAMSAEHFHAIRFARGTKVLFIEDPARRVQSHCLFPVVNGTICENFIWRDWMMAKPKEAA